jgi:hypothetical protein
VNTSNLSTYLSSRAKCTPSDGRHTAGTFGEAVLVGFGLQSESYWGIGEGIDNLFKYRVDGVHKSNVGRTSARVQS